MKNTVATVRPDRSSIMNMSVSFTTNSIVHKRLSLSLLCMKIFDCGDLIRLIFKPSDPGFKEFSFKSYSFALLFD